MEAPDAIESRRTGGRKVLNEAGEGREVGERGTVKDQGSNRRIGKDAERGYGGV
jgi:hypothetical protein